MYPMHIAEAQLAAVFQQGFIQRLRFFFRKIEAALKELFSYVRFSVQLN